MFTKKLCFSLTWLVHLTFFIAENKRKILLILKLEKGKKARKNKILMWNFVCTIILNYCNKCVNVDKLVIGSHIQVFRNRVSAY